jgi:cell division protein FtsL
VVRKKFKKSEIALGLFFILTVVVILTFYIWHQIESVRLGYQINNLEAQVIALNKEVEELEAKKSSLLSLDNVERIAKKELKLKPAQEDQIIYAELGKGSGKEKNRETTAK